MDEYRKLTDRDSRDRKVDFFLLVHSVWIGGIYGLIPHFRYCVFTKTASNRKSVSAVANMIGQGDKVMKAWSAFVASEGEWGYFLVDLKVSNVWTSSNPGKICEIIFATDEAKRRCDAAAAASAAAGAAHDETPREQFCKAASAVNDEPELSAVLFDIAFEKRPTDYLDSHLRFKCRRKKNKDVFTIHCIDLINCVLNKNEIPSRDVRGAFAAVFAANPGLPKSYVRNEILAKML